MTDVTITVDRQVAMVWMRDAMSNLSQDCWYAGWLGDTEEYVPVICRATVAGKTAPWGECDTIDLDLARSLCAIADALGHWVDMDGKPYIPECDKIALSKGK